MRHQEVLPARRHQAVRYWAKYRTLRHNNGVAQATTSSRKPDEAAVLAYILGASCACIALPAIYRRLDNNVLAHGKARIIRSHFRNSSRELMSQGDGNGFIRTRVRCRRCEVRSAEVFMEIGTADTYEGRGDPDLSRPHFCSSTSSIRISSFP